MKTTIRVVLFIGLWVISHSVFAQDVIVLKTGDEIKAIIQEVGTETIKYKKYTNADGPTYTMLRSDIFMLKYQSGEKDVFSPDDKEETQSADNVQTQQSDIQEELSIIRDKLNRGAHRETKRSADSVSDDLEQPADSEYELSDDCALLHIYRPKSMAGMAISYDLHLDNDVVFKVKNNSKTTIRITEEGLIKLWAKTESKVELPVDIQLGNEYYIQCGIKMGLVVGRPTMKIVSSKEGRTQYAKITLKNK